MATPTDHDRRLKSERDFHDRRFAGHNDRTRAKKFYRVDSGKRAYRDAVLTLAPGADVLEYGCGLGSLAIPLTRRRATVTGIDISPIAVRKARRAAKRAKRTKRARFAVMDAHDLDLPDGSFDIVCGSGILHHLDLAAALPEIARVLRSDGVAIFYEPLGTNPLINLYRRLTPSMRTPDEHPLLPEDFAVAEAHFAEIEREEHTFLALTAAVLQRLGPAGRVTPKLHRVDRWLFDHVPWTRRFAWVVVLRLRGPRT